MTSRTVHGGLKSERPEKRAPEKMERRLFSSVYCSLFVLCHPNNGSAAPKKLYFHTPGGCKAKANLQQWVGANATADSNRCVCVNSTVTGRMGVASRSFPAEQCFVQGVQLQPKLDTASRTSSATHVIGISEEDVVAIEKDPKCEGPEHHFFDGRICVKSFFTSGECSADGTTCFQRKWKVLWRGPARVRRTSTRAVQEGKMCN
ncbi:hypothetical protein BaRGS_00028203 [Batillaria attramentaria]|uniref:Uncharacterized protein n=1 Tax=Batillaria attramentaria TaxID=370345 RepID=A0ABD0K0W5_9CAEN